MTTQAHTPTPTLEIKSGCVFIRLPDDKKRWFLFSTTGEFIGSGGNTIGDLYWKDAPNGCDKVRDYIGAVIQAVNAYAANQALISEQAAEIAEQKKRADDNFNSYERVKAMYSAQASERENALKLKQILDLEEILYSTRILDGDDGPCWCVLPAMESGPHSSECLKAREASEPMWEREAQKA